VTIKVTLRQPFLFGSDQQYTTNELSDDDDDDMEVLWILLNEFKSLGIQLHVNYSETSSQRPSHLSQVSPPMDLFKAMLNQAIGLCPSIHVQQNSFFQLPIDTRDET
jgi:hypothetical protein